MRSISQTAVPSTSPRQRLEFSVSRTAPALLAGPWAGGVSASSFVASRTGSVASDPGRVVTVASSSVGCVQWRRVVLVKSLSRLVAFASRSLSTAPDVAPRSPVSMPVVSKFASVASQSASPASVNVASASVPVASAVAFPVVSPVAFVASIVASSRVEFPGRLARSVRPPGGLFPVASREVARCSEYPRAVIGKALQSMRHRGRDTVSASMSRRFAKPDRVRVASSVLAGFASSFVSSSWAKAGVASPGPRVSCVEVAGCVGSVGVASAEVASRSVASVSVRSRGVGSGCVGSVGVEWSGVSSSGVRAGSKRRLH